MKRTQQTGVPVLPCALVKWLDGAHANTFTHNVSLDWIHGINATSPEFPETYAVEWRVPPKPRNGWPLFDGYVIDISSEFPHFTCLLMCCALLRFRSSSYITLCSHSCLWCSSNSHNFYRNNLTFCVTKLCCVQPEGSLRILILFLLICWTYVGKYVSRCMALLRYIML